MSNRVGWTVISVLFVVILVLLYFLIVTPAHAPTVAPSQTDATTTTPQATTTPSTISGQATSTVDQSGPLHERVVVTTPKSGGSTLRQFEVTGEAPGNWYFEASFPVQVRDPDGNILSQTAAQAQSDWMTTDQVPFKASVRIGFNYSGPATLILLRDNPSGLPQNDDALEIPITII